MPEFRKKLTAREINMGSLTWEASQDSEIKAVLPASLVFDMLVDGQEVANLSVEWDKRNLLLVNSWLTPPLTLKSLFLAGGNAVRR